MSIAVLISGCIVEDQATMVDQDHDEQSKVKPNESEVATASLDPSSHPGPISEVASRCFRENPILMSAMDVRTESTTSCLVPSDAARHEGFRHCAVTLEGRYGPDLTTEEVANVGAHAPAKNYAFLSEELDETQRELGRRSTAIDQAQEDFEVAESRLRQLLSVYRKTKRAFAECKQSALDRGSCSRLLEDASKARLSYRAQRVELGGLEFAVIKAKAQRKHLEQDLKRTKRKLARIEATQAKVGELLNSEQKREGRGART